MRGLKIHITSIFFTAVAILFLYGCSTNKLANDESNYQYDNKIKDLNPEYLVYHKNDTLSYLYLEIQTANLLYVRENNSKPFEAEVSFFYELYSDYKGKVLIDSATKVLFDYKSAEGAKKIFARIPLNLPFGKNGVLKITAKDINKKIKDEQVIEINKSDRLTEQFFLFKDEKKETIYFDCYFTLEDTLTVVSDFNANGIFEVQYFNTNYPASPPPFSDNKNTDVVAYKDSVFLLSLSETEGKMELPKLGSYYIKHPDSLSFAVILQKMDSNFDNFHTYLGMIEPLKYICTSREYAALEKAENKRKAVEQFWLRMGGSKERARVIIQEYYRRVKLANKYFTSYKEGWKTDRGMLSIVMGLPNTIYKTNRGETWVFGTPHNMMMSLTFNFNLEDEQKVKNNYQLVRYRTYRDYWYRACESWRQGRVYNFN